MVADLMTGVESAALVKGVEFLYQQAAEVLRAWRERRQDHRAPAPRVIEPPAEIHIERADPLPDPTDLEMLDTLQELKALVQPINDGLIDADSTPAREAVANLRDLLEAVLRGPITFDGERPRTEIADVNVVVKQVKGQVAGVHAQLAKLPGRTAIRKVHVQSDNVEPGGEAVGVKPT